MAIAAAVTVLAWLAVLLLSRRILKASQPVPEMPAAERFRLAVERLRRERGVSGRWAALADATRSYLSATEPALGMELTTFEFLAAMAKTNIRPQDAVVAILRQGDLEKFSPWGAAAMDFDALALRALELIPAPVMELAA
jgi:hypothetical protein